MTVFNFNLKGEDEKMDAISEIQRIIENSVLASSALRIEITEGQDETTENPQMILPFLPAEAALDIERPPETSWNN